MSINLLDPVVLTVDLPEHALRHGEMGAVVQAALSICGIAGFRNVGEYSMGRHLRDAHSAALMVHNDRILEHNASLLCVMKDG